MFNQTWKKYLPVLLILMKRSLSGPQILDMNHTDFERAAGGRKIKYSFSSLQLNNGRIITTPNMTALARELAVQLQEDAAIMAILKNQQFHFSMTNDFKLAIKNTTVTEALTAEAEIAEAAAAVN
jgi:guanylate kinase